MGTANDPVWAYLSATEDDPRRFVCKFCTKTLFGNLTILKKHVVSKVCTPPADVYRILLERLVGIQRKDTLCSSCRQEHLIDSTRDRVHDVSAGGPSMHTEITGREGGSGAGVGVSSGPLFPHVRSEYQYP